MNTRPISSNNPPIAHASSDAATPAKIPPVASPLAIDWQVAKNLPAWDLLPANGTVVRRVAR